MRGNENLLSQIVERSLNEIYVFDVDTLKFVYVNAASRHNLEYSVDELKEMTPLDIKLDYSIEKFKELIAPLSAANTKTSEIVFETRHKRKSGKIYAVEIHLQLGSYDGMPVYVAIALDITKCKQHESELLSFRAAMDASPDSIYFTDPEAMRFLYVNHAATQRSGYSEEQLLELGPELMLIADREKLKSDYGAAIAAGKKGIVEEVEVLSKSGERPWSEVRHHALRLDDRWMIITFARDITEQKNTKRKLQQVHGELEARVAGRTQQLQLEIEQRKSSEQRATRAQEEMRLAKEEAEKASRVKTEFLSSMSHELRTPLNCILGFAQLLELSEAEFSSKQNLYIRHILSSGEQLLKLVSDVLELHTIEAGRLSLQLGHVSAHEVIEDCLEQIRFRAREKNVQLVNQCIPLNPQPYLWSDATRLKQLLLNLLINAIKYNVEGGTVTISCEQVPDNMLRISVSDTGAGIPQDHIENLFIPFERLGRETGPIEGTGIGLSIAKRLIELLGGTIGYVTKEGKGSTFWVNIPMSKEQKLAAASIDVATNAATKEVTNHDEASNSRVILYIEDDPDNQSLMKHILAQLPEVEIELLTAHNAELGLDLARKHHPDVILLDINLPGMNGLEAVQKLKKSQETSTIPVIAISVDATPHAIEKAIKYGFEAYITKPINVKETQRTIAEFLESPLTD